MKNIRPFGWVIIALNAYLIIAYLTGLDLEAGDTVVGFSLIIFMFFLTILNVPLYILYKITGRKKNKSDNTVTSPTDQSQTKSMISDSEKARQSRNFKLIMFIIIPTVVLFWIFNSFLDNQSDNVGSGSKPNTTTIEISWIPSGYSPLPEDSDIAYRWLETNEYDCSYGDSCWGMMIISKDGCPNSLYAEISILDKSNVQIAYTNDSLSSAAPMQKNKMIFQTFEDEAKTGRLSKISCR